VALLLALIPALVSCPRKPSKKAVKDTLVVHVEAEPAHLLSMIRPDFWAKRITANNVRETLIRMDPRSYKLQGVLASTWKVSPDRLTYTFYLRRGVRWHDGRPFTAGDVKHTLDLLLDKRVPAASVRASLAPYLSSYRISGEDRFVMVCKQASPFFMPALSDLEILPAHRLRADSISTSPYLRKPLGTGPYRFVSWTTGQRIVLQRFDGYWGPKPRIRRLVYRVVSDPDVALKLARRRELDFVPRVRPAQWVGVVARDKVFQHEFLRIRHFPPGNSFIMLNYKRPFLADRRVRLALAKLLDLDTVVDKIVHGLGKRVGALYWFKDPDYNHDIKPLAYDPAGARKLLAAAGFSDTDDNGVLDRDGEPLRFTFLLASVSRTQQRWATIWQQALRKAGVVMEISPMDWLAYLNRLQNHDFDVASLGMRWASPYSDLYYQLHSSQIDGGQNFSGYKNRGADRLMEGIRTEMDPARRRAMSLRLQKMLADDVALIPLYAEEEPGIVSRRVHGVYTSALWYQVKDWWIE
jgi:peptide/nickel transport system substrate-binding protein